MHGNTAAGAAAVNGLGRVTLARGDIQLAKKQLGSALATYTQLNASLEVASRDLAYEAPPPDNDGDPFPSVGSLSANAPIVLSMCPE